MVDCLKQNGRVTLGMYSEREPQTRSTIYTHDDASVVCLVQGEMTLDLEGKQPIRKPVGECYSVASVSRLIGFYSGNAWQSFIDFFNIREGGQLFTVREGRGCEAQAGGLD